ncbi:hypothetical protein BB559_003364 [Furculomyces boomerangus]|uniref:Cell cycle control protein n=2 Tax=Harpellales TaxID=61421 RepID=A0A2T9YLQ3_9FUNG|nr:hypothetical protein BB559_003364 [Furculomyces boomerangus]PWA00420.1 hypothetical protein BB558_003519 [Smittium angustum]
MSFQKKGDKAKSKRPANTAFKQQRLRAWQPLLTPKTVLPTFFIIGIIFAPIGGILFWASQKLFEITINYTTCAKAGSDFSEMNSNQYSLYYGKSGITQSPPSIKYNSATKTCSLRIPIPVSVPAPIFLYYKLTNFYQNHRRYVKSFDKDQLNGVARSASSLSGGDCEPLSTRTINGTTKPIYPCGLIANSVFNDTINDLVLLNPKASSELSEVYPLTSDGVAWDSDTSRFKKTSYSNNDVYPPPNWDLRYPYGYTNSTPIPDISKDSNLIVWMRTAGLPTFRKLHGRNINDQLSDGIYQIDIVMNYDVESFGGTKSIVISTTSAIGGRNAALGISYIVVGCLCFILGVIFTVRHLYRPRRLGDHTYLSWNQQVQSGLSEGSTNIGSH